MTHDHNHKKIGWTILLNIIITVAEYIGGVISGSLALLSDAGHNFSDVLALILGYFGEKVSEKKADKEHSFGFKRFEIFTALINALALIVIAFYIIFEAFQRFNEQKPISLGVMLTVGLIGLFGNLISILILNREKDSSVNMKAAYMHLFYDTISSVFVIITGVIIYFTDYFAMDIIVSIIIAVMILYSSLEILKKIFHILMQGVPSNINFDKVCESIKHVNGVEDVHSVHIWSIDSNENFLSCHVCIGKVKNSDKILEEINKKLSESFGIDHTTIQMEQNNLCKTGTVCVK